MWVVVILAVPFAVLWELMKMNEKAHHRRRRRKKF